MLALASSAYRKHLADHVDCINEDFSRATLKFQPFDLIVCLGVLAHVESPVATIEKIIRCSRLRHGHRGMHRCATSSDEAGRRLRLAGSGAFPVELQIKRSNAGDVVQMFEGPGLYANGKISPVLPCRNVAVLSQAAIYRLVRALCGSASRNRRACSATITFAISETMRPFNFRREWLA